MNKSAFIRILRNSDERKLIERFLNSEKYYIQLLKNVIAMHLSNLSDAFQEKLDSFLTAIKIIFSFHADSFQPKLLQCEMNTLPICDLIKTSIEAKDFNSYLNYAAFVTEAVSLIVGNNVRFEFLTRKIGFGLFISVMG